MGTKNYIAALELGSSKVSGAVAVENYDGINVIAYACEPVSGFISKGIVRNIDETSRCLSNIINKLESQLDGVAIHKAYVALGGLSIQSVKSMATREFREYTKITQHIIEEMAVENDSLFTPPPGYQRVQVLTQEYRMGGDISTNPIGMSVKKIECSYINIIVREQFMRQLEESFRLAKIDIADSFTAASIVADQLLSTDEKRDGCVLVDMGADTTTVAIYSGGMMRKLCVLPLGGANITRDLQAEHISQEDAETLKIHAGYKAQGFESSISSELRDSIIGARMAEILKNVNHRIKHSGENITNVVITGGAARLKNIEILLADNLPGQRVRIMTDFLTDCNISNKLSLKRDEPGATLLGLLKNGKENCCEETAVNVQMENMFKDEEGFETPAAKSKEEKKKTEPKPTKKPEKKPANDKQKTNFFGFFGGITESIKKGVGDFVDNATKEEEEVNFNDDNN